MPQGLLAPDEAELGKVPHFLSDAWRDKITEWWLARAQRARTPNWDLVSTCTIAGKRGLLLVEAKAHAAELSSAGKPAGNLENEPRIRAAISEANAALGSIVPGWHLSADSHYQLANRFAWAWKLASEGIPTVLVYLGYLNASEMFDCGPPFESHHDWERVLRAHCQGIVPQEVWGTRLDVGPAAIVPLICSSDIRVTAHSEQPPRAPSGVGDT